MPPPEKIHRHQRALLWERIGTNRYGDPIVGEPTEIKVRWEAGQEDVRKPDGTYITIDARVVVNQVVPIGSNIWLAPNNGYSVLEQYLGSGSASEDTDIMQVVTVNETPDIKNRNKRRVLGVARFKQDIAETE